jgi:transcriptional regulator with XRE-family HTH domain
MGRYSRKKPERLAEKLLRIRLALGLSQNEFIRHLGLEDEITQSRISGYELGTREPSLPTLLKYAHAAGVCVDTLIDDRIGLPDTLPSTPKHGSIKQPRSRKM